MTSDPPGFALQQALRTSLNQDWSDDFDDPYEALEDWFRRAGERPENLEPLIADIDELFAETSSTDERLERLGGIYLRSSDLDPLLRATRNRAVTGLAGTPEPMRAP